MSKKVVTFEQLAAAADSDISASAAAELERRELIDLLRWVARSIRTINALGKKMDKKCLLCAPSRLHKEPCRHAEIWKLTE